MSPRKRIGLIMPAQDSTSEADFALALGLEDYSIHGQRIWDGCRHLRRSADGPDER